MEITCGVYIKRICSTKPTIIQSSPNERKDVTKYKNPLESYSSPMEFGIENQHWWSAKRQHIHKIKFHARLYAYPSHRSMALIIIKHCHHMIFIKRLYIPFRWPTYNYNCADCLYFCCCLLLLSSVVVVVHLCYSCFCHILSSATSVLQICMIR